MADHLTDAVVKRLPVPAEGNKIVYDDEVSGFGARVSSGGSRSYVLNYRLRGTQRERRYTIGDATHWRATAARAEAKRLKFAIDQGGDPLGDLQDERAAPTIADLCQRFETEHFPRLRHNTREYYAGAIKNRVLPFFGAKTKVADVSYEDIDRLHRSITDEGFSYTANRVIAMLGKLFSLAMRWGICERNPCKGVERNYEAARKRYLSGEELARLIKALAEHDDRQAANIIRLLLLTGARKGEAFAMRWGDVDLSTGVWTKLGHTLKQKSDHVVPLSGPTRQLLADIRAEHVRHRPKQPLGEYVFPGRYGRGHRQTIDKDWRRLCKAADITGLRVHDMRHSYASTLAGAGFSLPVIGALLGHSQPSTTHRYAHLLDDPLRQATERVGAIVSNAGKEPPAPPVPLPIKGRRR
jgi:integrase